MQQYPIWHDVKSCLYKSSKSYGARDTADTTIYIGSSSKNSTEFIRTSTTRRFKYNEALGQVVCSFRFYVDGICIKEMIFEDNNGKVGQFIMESSYIPEVGL